VEREGWRVGASWAKAGGRRNGWKGVRSVFSEEGLNILNWLSWVYELPAFGKNSNTMRSLHIEAK